MNFGGLTISKGVIFFDAVKSKWQLLFPRMKIAQKLNFECQDPKTPPAPLTYRDIIHPGKDV